VRNDGESAPGGSFAQDFRGFRHSESLRVMGQSRLNDWAFTDGRKSTSS
jgi:ribosomal protein S13